MKRLTSFISTLFLNVAGILMSACSSTTIPSRPSYQIVSDSETVVIKGVLNRTILENEVAFTWMAENRKYGSADAGAVKVFGERKEKFTLLIFIGTWCHDSQNLLPVLYRLTDKSGFPDSRIKIVGVDRNKTAPHNWHQIWQITNVPTFIVLQNGKEAGRVVEYGTTGNIEKELAAIVARLP